LLLGVDNKPIQKSKDNKYSSYNSTEVDQESAKLFATPRNLHGQRREFKSNLYILRVDGCALFLIRCETVAPGLVIAFVTTLHFVNENVRNQFHKLIVVEHLVRIQTSYDCFLCFFVVWLFAQIEFKVVRVVSKSLSNLSEINMVFSFKTKFLKVMFHRETLKVLILLFCQKHKFLE